jgi:hypothetical protein
MLLDDGNPTEGLGPETRGFDEQSTQNTTDGAREDKRGKFEELPVKMISNFEEDDLLRAIRVKELECKCGGLI